MAQAPPPPKKNNLQEDLGFFLPTWGGSHFHPCKENSFKFEKKIDLRTCFVCFVSGTFGARPFWRSFAEGGGLGQKKNCLSFRITGQLRRPPCTPSLCLKEAVGLLPKTSEHTSNFDKTAEYSQDDHNKGEMHAHDVAKL